jgi:hypothetical protein
MSAVDKLLQVLLADECHLDHHGYCQAHFVTRPCIVAEAQREWATVGVPQPEGRGPVAATSPDAETAGLPTPYTREEGHTCDFDVALPGGWMGCDCGRTIEPRPTGDGNE